MPMPEWKLVSATTGVVVVPRCCLATTFWQRLRGLQFRAELAADEGLLLAPCTGIHTHWLRFSLDVLFLDATGIVLANHAAVKPWRIVSGPKSTYATLETAAGAIDDLPAVGTRVVLAGGESNDLPARLRKMV